MKLTTLLTFGMYMLGASAAAIPNTKQPCNHTSAAVAVLATPTPLANSVPLSQIQKRDWEEPWQDDAYWSSASPPLLSDDMWRRRRLGRLTPEDMKFLNQLRADHFEKLAKKAKKKQDKKDKKEKKKLEKELKKQKKQEEKEEKRIRKQAEKEEKKERKQREKEEKMVKRNEAREVERAGEEYHDGHD
ncbi:hypothetical protein P154DRAFT_530086 [Amniculicola lignicola CBS 123094]|uniref:Uncharacterized protein n=1 Tax=Amniculicola lignicola CBS 123094 TaxID=1392246 RepID=A0A6A5X234_9PLEO|nr:hypothetical protein P154DRAFT_530086 [Amniculicola lignicola CBS 123094]